MDLYTDVLEGWSDYLDVPSDANLAIFAQSLQKIHRIGNQPCGVRVHLYEVTEHTLGRARAQATAQYLDLSPTDKLCIARARKNGTSLHQLSR